jgi:hypothetical protein
MDQYHGELEQKHTNWPMTIGVILNSDKFFINIYVRYLKTALAGHLLEERLNVRSVRKLRSLRSAQKQEHTRT